MPHLHGKPANRNMLWAEILVDEFHRAGLHHVVIAPGSRSTPLAIAFGAHPGIQHYVHLDERGAAFFALGLAQQSGQTTAVLCTSGTAAANFFPAVVEASASDIPLLLLTADRPDELRGSGSNQTIDQVKMFGDFVRWFVQAPQPEAAPGVPLLRALQTLACRVMAETQGRRPGPVHMNLPFRKPLEPVIVEEDIPEERGNSFDDRLLKPNKPSAPFVAHLSSKIAPSLEQVALLVDAISHAQRPLIYCGPRCPRASFAQDLLSLAALVDAPVFADALSGLRFHPAQVQGAELVFGGYETFLKSQAARQLPGADLVIQFGGVPVSQALAGYLEDSITGRRIQVSEHGAWSDDAFTTSDLVLADPAWLCREVASAMRSKSFRARDQGWKAALQQMESRTWRIATELQEQRFFEGGITMDLLAALPDESRLFVANSLSVRNLDQFGAPRPQKVDIYCNRGASGIDGTLASAAGVAAADPDRWLALLSGDLAFLHDLNSLLLIKAYTPRMLIVVVNNDGGGIFQRLPVSNFEPYFTPLFLTPHGLNFAGAATMFGLEYCKVSDRAGLQEQLRDKFVNPRPALLEVQGDAVVHEMMRREFQRRLELMQ